MRALHWTIITGPFSSVDWRGGNFSTTSRPDTDQITRHCTVDDGRQSIVARQLLLYGEKASPAKCDTIIIIIIIIVNYYTWWD